MLFQCVGRILISGRKAFVQFLVLFIYNEHHLKVNLPLERKQQRRLRTFRSLRLLM